MNLTRWLPVLTLLAGCATTQRGLVQHTDGRLELLGGEGKVLRLEPTGESVWVHKLDGVFVEVDGVRRLGGRVVVDDFRVHEGAHGMQAWVGILRDDDGQLGLNDRSSGGYWAVGEETAPRLRQLRGKPVMLEGYVEGAHRIHVVYFRVLVD